MTRNGSPCLIVSYYLPNGETVKQWLFQGNSVRNWWRKRSRRDCPADLESVAQMAAVGVTKPTSEITYVRDGSFNKVTAQKIGNFDPKFAKWMTEVTEIFGDFTVMKVVS